MSLQYPPTIEPTPESERKSTSKFDSSYRATESDLSDQMRLLRVDGWRLEDEKGPGSSPGLILRWTKDGTEYAVVADKYDTKKDNARELYLWVKETRKRKQRNVRTARDAFASARLPSGKEGDSDAELPRVDSGTAAHLILGVSPDADDAEVREAYRSAVQDLHPDKQTGDSDAFKRLQEAREAMVDGR